MSKPADYDPAVDLVHGATSMHNSARSGGWSWGEPRGGAWFRTCSFCGCIHPEDLAAELVERGACAVCAQVDQDACFRAQGPGIGRDEMLRMLNDPSMPEGLKTRLRGLNPNHPYDPGGAYASWADRKYGFPHKFYVENLKSRDPERLYVISARSRGRGDAAREHDPGWISPDEIPEGTVADGWRDVASTYDSIQIGKRPTLHAKFYTEHLRDPAISQDAKDAIGRCSNLRITFTDDGRIGWEPWQ